MYGPGIGAYQTGTQTGILSLLKKINFSSILNTTQKTLNIANQAIPIIYQVKPIINNAKTMFKIIGAVKDNNKTSNISNNSYTYTKNNTHSNYKTSVNYNSSNNYGNTNAPNFFI